MKRFLIGLIITPKRARKIVARAISAVLQRVLRDKTWFVAGDLATWLRKLADFIDRWNVAELPADKDKIIAELVGSALTDEAVDHLIDEVAALEMKPGPDGTWAKED